jgi:hypothetical protein
MVFLHSSSDENPALDGLPERLHGCPPLGPFDEGWLARSTLSVLYRMVING